MFSSISLWEKVNFFRLLSVTQKSWLWIRESLEAILYSEKNPTLRKIISSMIDGINEWKSLSWVMEEHKNFFDNSEIALISSAETMGNLPETLDGIANELENLQLVKSKIKNAMMYPVMVILFAIWAVVVLLVKVLPNIISMFPEGKELPWITVFMLDLSAFLKSNWQFVFGTIIWLVVLYRYAYNNILPFKILMDKFFLEFPVISNITRLFHHYRFSKLLWDFYKAWVSPVVAMDFIYKILPNWHYKEKVLQIKKDLELGLSFLDSMEWSNLFDVILIQILWVGEKTWNIEIVLEKISSFYRTELNNKIEWLTRVIEPILMAGVAWIIWLIVASIFLPLASLINNIGM